MNKKQLSSQNDVLFAEVERRAGEIRALQLRIEEQNEKYQQMTNQLQAAEQTLQNALQEIERLTQENETLKREMERFARGNEELKQQNSAIKQPDEIPHPVADCKPLDSAAENQPAATEQKAAAESTEDVFTPHLSPSPQSADALPKAPIDTALRQYGAEMIGRVTKAAAQCIASAEQPSGAKSEDIKHLALGKNEAFKQEVLILLESSSDPVMARAELKRRAEEAIGYLSRLN